MIDMDKVEQDYQSGMPYKDIATKYGVTLSTVKSWKVRRHWRNRGHKRVLSEHDRIITSLANNDELSEQQKLFCLHFADCLNATQAYMRVYNCKWTTAAAEGNRMIKVPKIKAEIDHIKRIKYDAALLKADDLVNRQMRIAFADVGDYIDIRTDSKGRQIMTLKSPDKIDSVAISELKNGRDGLVIKMKDSQKAIEWLTKYFEYYPADQHRRKFDDTRLEIERKKADAMIARSKEPTAPPEAIVLQPIYGKPDKDGEDD